jgi:hypothetical protein
VPEDAPRGRSLEFIRGLFYFFHKDKTGELELRSRVVNSVVRGTELVIQIQDDGTTEIHLIDGVVEMTNNEGTLTLRQRRVRASGTRRRSGPNG